MPLTVAINTTDLAAAQKSPYVDYRSKMPKEIQDLLNEYQELELLSLFMEKTMLIQDLHTPSLRKSVKTACDVIVKFLDILEAEIFVDGNRKQLAQLFFAQMHRQCADLSFYMSLSERQTIYADGQKGGYSLRIQPEGSGIMQKIKDWDIVADLLYFGKDKPPVNVKESLRVFLGSLSFERIS
jgi:hypothetical protein